MRHFVVAFAITMHLVLGDAVVKELAASRFRDAACTVIAGFFNLAYVENRGCAWGMLQGHVWPLAVFGAAALVFVVWKRKVVFGERGFASLAAECLLCAGIIGNLIDRVFRGYVIDMFDFHWGELYHFPCFNLADAYITASVVLLMVEGLAKPVENQRSQ